MTAGANAVASIWRLAQTEGIAVLGIGPSAALADEPPGRRPEDLLPGATSLISFSVPVPRGVYRESPHAAEIIWRSQNLYYRRLDTLAIRISALIEDSGEQAAPVFGCFPMALNEKGEVVGYLNLIRMGEATGIGRIGRNGLLLHPHFGARLMLGGLVTSASLPPLRNTDALLPDCPADCRVCVDACPVHAISPDENRVDIMRCLAHTARIPLMPKIQFLFLRASRPGAAARLMNLTAMDDHTLHVCSRCVAHCPYGDAPLGMAP